MGNETPQGHCTCRDVRYRLLSAPLIVHCCHCTWCQRETGSAFVLNALIEASRVELQGVVEQILTASSSGKGQKIARCPRCRIALWSNYQGAGDRIHFVRVGTLEEPAQMRPDIHIFTSTKLPWVILPDGVPCVPEFYDLKAMWRPDSLQRLHAARAQ